MLKTSMMMLAAMIVVGGSGLQAQAATAPDVSLGAGGGLTESQETWEVAHVSQWGHYHQCNPSPCKRLRDRHKKGTGSVTE
jgi:hypothetical protein